MSPDTVGAEEMRLDDLARAAGAATSTVRLYRSMGLVPPPVRRGRVAWYTAEHLGRLRLIARLQERGFSLAGIKELLDGMDRGESLLAVLGVGEGTATWTPERSASMSLEELASHLPDVELDADLVRRVVDLGLVELADDGDRVVVRSPSFLRIGSALVALGIPADVVLDQYDVLRGEADRMAARFTEVFREHLWAPFVQSGMRAEQVDPLIRALEQLGPLAEAVVVMSLRHALQDAAQRFVEAEAERLDVPILRPGAT